MMNQLIEFTINHWEMVAVFLAILATVAWNEQKGGAKSVSAAQATALINNEDAVVIDIRPATEFRIGHITSSINIPASTFKDKLSELEKHKSKPIILVCKTGISSGSSAKEMQKAGFNVFKLHGGITEWQASSLPLVKS